MKSKVSGCLVQLLILAGVILLFSAIAAKCFHKSDYVLGGDESGHRVGIVDVKGVIMGSDRIIADLRKLAGDTSIATIVIRIDSPGGAVGPSQGIYREIERVREQGKVVIAAMETVAASGGYYVASACNKIVAHAGSLTGSIGVITESPDVSEMAAWLKLKVNTIKSGPLKDTGSAFRPMTESDRSHLQSIVDDIYNVFVDDVAKGRKLDRESVVKVADGRVLTGRQAKEAGLVDKIGNFSDALELSLSLANLSGEPTPVHLRHRDTDLILDLLKGGVNSAAGYQTNSLVRDVIQKLGSSMRIVGSKNSNIDSDMSVYDLLRLSVGSPQITDRSMRR